MEKKIHMIGNTHIDIVWLWERAEGIQEVKSSFLSVLDRMEEFPDFKFTQSSISFLAWMKENCPADFKRIQERVKEGRWEIVGGMWVEPDCNLPSGESMVRHFLYSKQFVEENFDQDVVTCYNVDSFGHGSNMPAICSGCGIKYYLMSRPAAIHVKVPPVFVWKSRDGSSVIAERTGGEYMAWTRPALEFNLSESLTELDRYGYDRMAVFYGAGNHGGGPTIENIRTIYEMREEYGDLELDFSTLNEFFEQVETDKIPEECREMGPIYTGCYSSDCQIKTLNRHAEWALIKAEVIGTMAKTMGINSYEYPKQDLERAWKHTLFQQFHDLLAGTSIEPARNEACMELSASIAEARRLTADGIQAIANHMDTRGDGFPLILFNPTGTEYRGVFASSVYVPRALKKNLRVRDSVGNEIPYAESAYENYAPDARKVILFEADVPAYGYAGYRLIYEGADLVPEEDGIKAEKLLLDNGIVKICFDKASGCPSSIQTCGRELLSAVSAFRVYQDDRGAWGEDVYEDELLGQFCVTGNKVLEANGMRAVVRFFLEYERSEMMVDYILEKGSDRLKMEVKLRNGEKQKLIMFCVPVAAKEPVVDTETGFLSEQKIDCYGKNMEHYQHRFADIQEKKDGSGMAVINDCIYGFQQAGSEYRLILLRSSSFARGGRGPLEENLEGRFMNQGTFDYQLILLPHEGELPKERLFSEADFLHMPVEYLGDCNHRGENWLRRRQLLSIEKEGVHLSVVKIPQGKEDGLIIRLFETEGKDGYANVTYGTNRHSMKFGPYEIKTIHMDSDQVRECNLIEK